MDKIAEILDFWFEGIDDKTPINKGASPFNKWYKKDEKFDLEIRQRFEADFLKAKQGGYKSWEDSGPGRLALIILFDQFSRNMYRGSPKMFEMDSLALDLALRSIKDFRDQQLQIIDRVFLYMPLQHAENRATQELSLKQFQSLTEESKLKTPHNTAYYEYTFDYAKQHRAIIERFGRFPHRNGILGRPSTEEESDFLKKPGSGF